MDVKYTVFASESRTRAWGGNFGSGIQMQGLLWDDAVEQCNRRNMQIAAIKNVAEQAAAVDAIFEANWDATLSIWRPT